MSRVTYTDMAATGPQDALRGTNQVRLVTEAQEGTGVNALPAGVYGFTYSPGLASAPLFAVRRYRSYEIHKRARETLVQIPYSRIKHHRQYAAPNQHGFTVTVVPR